MSGQLYILLSFFLTGICIGVLFDVFRVTRKTFKIPNILIYIEDILFWILTGFLLLFTTFTFTNGEIRLYMIIVMLLGSFIYFISISKYFILINSKIINFIKKATNLLLKPIKLIIKIINPKKIFKILLKNSGK